MWSTIERRTPWSNIASVLNKYTKITFLKWNANCNRCWKNISVIIITIFINKIVWFCQDTRSFLGDLLNYFLINWFVNKNQVNNFCKKIFFVNKKLVYKALLSGKVAMDLKKPQASRIFLQFNFNRKFKYSMINISVFFQ